MVLKAKFWDEMNCHLAGMRNTNLANSMIRISPLLMQYFKEQEAKHKSKTSSKADSRETSVYPQEGNNGTFLINLGWSGLKHI